MMKQLLRLLLILGLSSLLVMASCGNPKPMAQKNLRQQTIKHSKSKEREHLIHAKQLPISKPLPERVEARGIYVTGWVAGSQKSLKRLLELLDRTDLNTLVIDVKDDYGHLTYNSSIPLVRQIKADRNPGISDIRALLAKLKSKNIYTIGRIVTFKDPYFAKHKPEWAMRTQSGQLWRGGHRTLWMDPYRTEVWSYNIDIAKEAARLGFDEIQFDYVRFPDNASRVDREVVFANPKHISKAENIRQFLHTARGEIHKAGSYVSADVFGLVTSSENDMGIGQIWESIAQEVDYISPMTYPSHYSGGMYGIKNPDLVPDQVIKHAITDAKRRNETLKQAAAVSSPLTQKGSIVNADGPHSPAIIRPWLQSFTATWMTAHRHYGIHEVLQQVKELERQGIHQFLLWNSSCKYTYE